ncbi:DUF4336 domain-containing protein [Mesorhizobium sp. M0808]|uniref:DUF4336 domain-containing protein n=1 Tax=Mesorhizobium sp. M0808 TaxID=2957002 RepID=UPI00333C2794
MLEPLGSDLWFADGGVVSFKGFDYPTRMVVVRLADGALWLWSPVERTAALEGKVRALGPVRHIISPNKLHFLFLGQWQTPFPDASLWATAATIAKCRELRFSGALADDPPAEWKGQIDQFYFTNLFFMNELIFFHRASRTAIIADLSQTFSEPFLKRHWPWWMRPIAKLSKMVEGWGHPPIDYRISFRNRASARPKIRELIGKHPEHVVVAHGEVVRTDGEAFLRRAFFMAAPVVLTSATLSIRPTSAIGIGSKSGTRRCPGMVGNGLADFRRLRRESCLTAPRSFGREAPTFRSFIHLPGVPEGGRSAH